MKRNILTTAAAALALASTLTGCMEEYEPQRSYVSAGQVSESPKAFEVLTEALTSTLTGSFIYNPSSTDAYDFGYPALMIERDIMGQDITPVDCAGTEWFTSWYSSSVALGPNYAVCQMPWTYYYGWIKNCNIVISTAGAEPSESQYSGVGQAYAMRAFFYLDLVRMYSQKTYALDKSAETVPAVTESNADQMANNPRMTNEEAYAFILSDLDKAEKYLANYQREDKYTPDLSVVYGLKARAYLTMEDWANAEKYAKLAQTGYTMMTNDEYTSHTDGFNSATSNNAWMFAVHYKSTDPNISKNDADSSWGSKMITESNSGCGYAASYGYPLYIDRHLYETIPATDARKKCFLNFEVDDATSLAELYAALSPYTDDPDALYANGGKSVLNGMEVKFRNAGGTAGLNDQYTGFCVDVPLMRVEEMKLIEIEAAGMQNEANGIALLKAFAQQRDPNFEYGKHNEAYGNTSTSAFQNEVWWQRRVEFWGEGLATFDIKRLNKGIIRSYANTNHVPDYRWNTTSAPEWMNFCITRSETAYNTACTNNPTPSAPTSDSDEYVW